MYLQGIILKCIDSIQMERTVSAIYYLVKGKKSIQTVQDARLFQLERFYSIDKALKLTTFYKIIAKLKDNGLIISSSDVKNVYQLTVRGKEQLVEDQQSIPFHYFNGFKY